MFAHKALLKLQTIQGAASNKNFVGSSFNDMYFNDINCIY
jgi:hypothetical protein